METQATEGELLERKRSLNELIKRLYPPGTSKDGNIKTARRTRDALLAQLKKTFGSKKIIFCIFRLFLYLSHVKITPYVRVLFQTF